MTIKKTIYHFLDPVFGYPFSKYFFEMGIQKEAEVILVFSTKNFKPNRRSWNPLRILDEFKKSAIQLEIIKKFKPFGFSIKFVVDVNKPRFINNISPQGIGICTGFNQIFRKELINNLEDFVNVHPSILPLYRGPTPVEWCIENKEKYAGWTLHRINDKIDAGEILYQQEVEIGAKLADEIKAEISNHAKKILFDYIQIKKANQVFEKKIIKADNYYLNKINYKSFYKET